MSIFKILGESADLQNLQWKLTIQISFLQLGGCLSRRAGHGRVRWVPGQRFCPWIANLHPKFAPKIFKSVLIEDVSSRGNIIDLKNDSNSIVSSNRFGTGKFSI